MEITRYKCYICKWFKGYHLERNGCIYNTESLEDHYEERMKVVINIQKLLCKREDELLSKESHAFYLPYCNTIVLRKSTNENNVTEVISHEYLHSIIFNLETYNTCADMDNIYTKDLLFGE